jgi:putative spermidine/putrescine transport system substrate-binding protein
VRRIAAAVTVWLGLLLVACSSSTATASHTADPWIEKTAAGAGGGMAALIAAAKAEGQLNVIGLPRDWAHYGALIDGFKSQYGITVNELDSNAVSQDEIDAATKAGKSKNAPDVFDLNMTVALANARQFAPYKVVTWDSIPDSQKNSDGTWYQDYGGYMAIGEDTAKLPAVATVDDLLQPKFKAKVAIKGDPMTDDNALAAVMMVALNEGGTLDNIAPGVDFFHKLKLKGNFLALHATQNTVVALQTPVVLDWEFISRTHTTSIATWQVVVPGTQILGSYYVQAINKDAPHPAAARLWEEYLYSTTGQNEWLRAGVRPVELAAMQTTGMLDPTAYAALPATTGLALFMTPTQAAAARTYLATTWAKAVG